MRYCPRFLSFAHLAVAAFRALARRWVGVSASARARPPFAAPFSASARISSRRAAWSSSRIGFLDMDYQGRMRMRGPGRQGVPA
jgi:hypothetical protein